MPTPCEHIAKKMGELFTCSSLNGHIRIRTPFLYPDGDLIDIFFKEENGTATLTDLGETLRWLRMQTASDKRSPKQKQLIEDVCMNHGVELYKGMLMARFRPSDNLAEAVIRISQAALRISDLWFTFRNRAVESITDEVESFMRDSGISYERGERIPGRSGRVWTLDFHTRQPNRSSFVSVLSTGSRAAARGVAEHVLATWYDLSHMKVGHEAIQFISLFDDTLDVWSPEEFKLVGDLSEISYWSRPDEFAAKLAA
ncbi:MAG: DUF1828 domain-containing protein [Nitrospirota bacterium]